MLTTSNISSISYNTETNLHRVLDDMYRKGKVDFYAYVKHFAEDDELKDHFHLFVIPSSKTDTNAFRNEFQELDPEDPARKPLGCLPFTKSKFPDWYLYSCHDASYLASKGQIRKHHYQKSDFVVSDEMYFSELIHRIDYSKMNKNKVIMDAINNNTPFVDLVTTGQIPVQQFGQYKAMFDFIRERQLSVFRGINEETGEVIESHTPLGDAQKALNELDAGLHPEGPDSDDLPF